VNSLQVQTGLGYGFPVIPLYNKKSLVFGVPGLFLALGCVFASDAFTKPTRWILTLLDIGRWGGAILWIVGLCYFAKAKGRNAAWGLFGFLACIGLAVLWFLEDKAKTSENPNPPSAP
jgi:hypothetical protein